jgi:hypothetical protein
MALICSITLSPALLFKRISCRIGPNTSRWSKPSAAVSRARGGQHLP